MWIMMGKAGKSWQLSSGELGSLLSQEDIVYIGVIRESGQAQQSLYCLRKVLKLDPNDVDTLYELASVYRKQDDAYRVSCRRRFSGSTHEQALTVV